MRPKHHNDYAHGKSGWVGGNPRYGRVRGNMTGYRPRRTRRYQNQFGKSAVEQALRDQEKGTAMYEEMTPFALARAINLGMACLPSEAQAKLKRVYEKTWLMVQLTDEGLVMPKPSAWARLADLFAVVERERQIVLARSVISAGNRQSADYEWAEKYLTDNK